MACATPLAAGWAQAVPSGAPPPARVVVVAASLWDGSSAPTGPVSLVIENGRIAAVRRGLAPPLEPEHRFDLRQWTIVPTAFAMKAAAQAHAADGLDVRSRLIEHEDPAALTFIESARVGATAFLLDGFPQSTFGGISSVYRPLDVWTPRREVVSDVGLAVALRARTIAPRRTAMEATWEVRKALLLARARNDSSRNGSARNDSTAPGESAASGADPLARLLAGSLRMQVATPTLAELARAVAVAEELGLRMLATGVTRVPDAPLPYHVVSMLLAPPRLDALSERWSTYAALRRQHIDAGILLGDVPLPALLALSRPHAAANGLTDVDMLAAFTAAPAGILGAKTVGRLAPGMSADFLVLSGDPFDARTRIERVFIEGREVYDRQRPRR